MCCVFLGILRPMAEIVEDFITNVPVNYETIETLAFAWRLFIHHQ
jgi:hypothetical protein